MSVPERYGCLAWGVWPQMTPSRCVSASTASGARSTSGGSATNSTARRGDGGWRGESTRWRSGRREVRGAGEWGEVRVAGGRRGGRVVDWETGRLGCKVWRREVTDQSRWRGEDKEAYRRDRLSGFTPNNK